MIVHIDDQGPVRRVLLDRPTRRNAIDLSAVEALHDALYDPPPVVVLRSAVPDTFCAGADLSVPDAIRQRVSDELHRLYGRMRATPSLVVVVADGVAVGGGAQLLLAADLRIATPALRVRFVGMGHGVVVGAWGLPAIIGRGRAMDLCLTEREIDAEECRQLGIVESLTADPDLALAQLVERVASLPAGAVGRLKTVLAAGVSNADDALEVERQINRSWDGSAPPRPDGGTW